MLIMCGNVVLEKKSRWCYMIGQSYFTFIWQKCWVYSLLKGVITQETKINSLMLLENDWIIQVDQAWEIKRSQKIWCSKTLYMIYFYVTKCNC